MSGKDFWNKFVFKVNRRQILNPVTTSTGKEFHRMDVATRNERKTESGVLWLSATVMLMNVGTNISVNILYSVISSHVLILTTDSDTKFYSTLAAISRIAE